MFYLYFLAFFVVAIGGFLYGMKVHLRRVSAVLLQCGMDPDQVGKVVHLVSCYRKLQREAKKQAREAYKKSIVDAQVEKMKKDGE